MLPLSFNLLDKKIVLVGGGRVALEKFSQLAKTGCVLTVIAPSFCAEFAEALKNPHQAKIIIHERFFQDEDVDGAYMVFSAIDDVRVSEAIFQLCRSQKILINSADNKNFCDFYTTAVIERGSVQISVSTQGRFAGLSALLRRHIENLFPEELDDAWEEVFALRERSVTLCSDNEKKSVILNIVKELETRYFKRG
ncbi:MAG: Siroheme synthase [Turneriella sp.]|nr:Siroheme synthase [Turneriella sp.]